LVLTDSQGAIARGDKEYILACNREAAEQLHKQGFRRFEIWITKKVIPGKGGEHYIPYSERTGEVSTVYFTRDLSPAGLQKLYERVNQNMTGKIGIKLHTGEKHGPNIIPRSWVENLIKNDIPDGTIVETNTYYEGDRYTTELHRETLKVNGWTFCPVDIMDEEGTIDLPVKGR